jgi:FkbM family methyltransferase
VSDRFPSKPITLDTYRFQLHGISTNDAYWNGLYDNFEPEFQRFCRQLIHPDYVCLDIGANIGVKTLFLSRHCPQGRVIAVEAGKLVADCLATNIAANGCPNVIPHSAAAAGHDGTLIFDEVSAWGHQAANGVEVEALTLESLVARHQLTRLDFVKIDVEGGEFPVLKSSLALFNRFESLVFVELNSLTLLVWGNTNPKEFLQWIGANFSHIYALNRGNPAGEMLTPVYLGDECRACLHRNLVDDGCVTDLVMSNAAYRFAPTPAYLAQQISKHLAELTQLRADLTRAQADLSQARANLEHASAASHRAETERDALLRSSSWRLTAPLRGVKQRMSRPPGSNASL